MNTKRIIFWICFIIVLILIVWGLIVAMNKPATTVGALSTPPEVTAADHVLGTSTAPITVIEYSDFQCPACGIFYPTVEKFIKEASSTVRFVYRHYPLPQHANAPLAAQAAEAAGKQGKFWDMYHLLFENQKDWSELPDISARQIFAGYASKIGLNTAQYTTDLDGAEGKLKIRTDYQDGAAIGVNSTPTFFANGKAVNISQPNYEIFKAAIEAAAQTRIP
ncbi:MAG: thioredoxin domain-containing protein [Patescibacteria group bacterium]